MLVLPHVYHYNYYHHRIYNIKLAVILQTVGGRGRMYGYSRTHDVLVYLHQVFHHHHYHHHFSPLHFQQSTEVHISLPSPVFPAIFNKVTFAVLLNILLNTYLMKKVKFKCMVIIIKSITFPISER